MNPAAPRARRAIVLRRADADNRELERLIGDYGLEVVFTVVADTVVPKLAALIAVQHVVEYGAEVLVLPHLTREQIRGEPAWRVVRALVQVVTPAGAVDPTPFTP